MNQVQDLVDIISRCGGELAVGVIHDQVNNTLVRLRIDAPPPEPATIALDPNPLRQRTQMAEKRKGEATYDDAVADWKGRMEERLATFLSAVEPLLSRPADATRSPIWEGVRRLDLFLGEKELAWPSDVGRYALLVTDGVETARGTPVAIGSPSAVIVINGSAEIGALAALKSARYESVEGAIRFITASEAR